MLGVKEAEQKSFQQLKYNMKFNTCLLEHKGKEDERMQSEVYKKIIKKYRWTRATTFSSASPLQIVHFS